MGVLKFPYELKKKNNFVVEFPEQFHINYWTVQKINKPSFSNGIWDNIKIEFVDPIGPSSSQSLYKIIEFVNSINDENESLFEFEIKSLDPTGLEVEKWSIYVEKIITINFGYLDYNKENIIKPFLIVKPLKCILN